MDISQYKELFITEAQEHLDALNGSLLELEKEPSNADVVAEIFRSAHTLKGMSATMGYDQLTELAHEMENLLEHIRSGDVRVTPGVVDILFSCFDTLGSIVDAIQDEKGEPVDYSWLVSEVRGAIEGGRAPSVSREPEREIGEALAGEERTPPGEEEPEREIAGVGESPEEIAGAVEEELKPVERGAETPGTPGREPPGETAPTAAPADAERVEEAATVQPGGAGKTARETVTAGETTEVGATATVGETAGEGAQIGEITVQAATTAPIAAPRQAVFQIDDAQFRKYCTIPGIRLLRLTVELDRDCVLKSVRVFMAFKKLAQLGEVLGSLPPVEALEDERFDRSFQVGLATLNMPGKIREALLGIAEVVEVSAEVLYEPPEEEKPAAPAGAPGSGAEGEALALARRTQSVRVNIARLDNLMNLVGELVINRTRLSEIASDYEISDLREALDQTMRLTADLQDEVMKTRMVPVEHVFNRFPRMVRDLARKQGKEIDFVVEGKEIELDRTILDEISDPLIHMIRNAVDHGIAIPEVRRAHGKQVIGTIRLSAYRDRNYVAVEVEDDGEGIDTDLVFDRAVERGLMTEDERRQLSAEDLLRVISMPGFSTSDTVDGISGRGVGMDAVKYKAESLGGFVILDTAPGLGTRVTLKLPLTLAIIQALLVEVDQEIYAVPLGIVRETQVVEPDDVKTIQSQEAVFLRDETVPLVRLDRLLRCGAAANGSEPFPVVIAEVGPRLVALGVHNLIGQREIVINTLDKFLKKVDGFAGATILGTGRVALILDIPSLIAGWGPPGREVGHA
jgi:two-component system chemotaxis sensor kinase CheA